MGLEVFKVFNTIIYSIFPKKKYFCFCVVPLQVPERVVCAIASGVWQEVEELEEDLPLRSATLLRSMDRASQTKHESQSRQAFEIQGLKVRVPLTDVDVGMEKPVPILKASDMLRTMALHNKVNDCLLGGGGLEAAKEFWQKYRALWPEHPVFERHPSRLQCCLPVFLHADEGRHLKNNGIFIANWQSVMGKGTLQSGEYQDGGGLNFQGSSFTTRFLLTTFLTVHYGNKKRGRASRLTKLFDAIVDDFVDLYESGLELSFEKRWIRLYLVPLGLKGDWPMLAKLGNLEQNFSRKGRQKADSAICHLCKAGSTGYPYHEYEINAKWYETYLKDRPWTTPGPLCRLPTLPKPELFFCFDVFHVCHKGIFAELAGSALVPLL